MVALLEIIFLVQPENWSYLSKPFLPQSLILRLLFKRRRFLDFARALTSIVPFFGLAPRFSSSDSLDNRV